MTKEMHYELYSKIADKAAERFGRNTDDYHAALYLVSAGTMLGIELMSTTSNHDFGIESISASLNNVAAKENVQ